MKVLVTGAGGGLGANVVRELVARGHEVHALVRDVGRAKLPEGVVAIVGDATDGAAMERAARGCAAVFHLTNVSIGNDWVAVTKRLLDAAIGACRASGARLVFPANVWVFGRGAGGVVDERAAIAPCSELGRARAAKEAEIRASGVRFVMIRLPEFYGPHVQTLTGRPLRAIACGGRGRWWGPADRMIEFVYMPDAARVLAEVGLADGVDGEVFHLPGAAPTTARAFFELAIAQAGGESFSAMPAALPKLYALVNPLARAFVDILHLWTHPILLDGAKLAARFPDLKSTSYADGIAATLAWHRATPTATMY